MARLFRALVVLTAVLCSAPASAWAQEGVLPPETSGSAAAAAVDTLAASGWTGVITDSLRLLLIEHTVRVILEERTRVELGGPFWNDYRRSVKVPQTWSDGDGWRMNYVGHPIHGAAAGHIWLNNMSPEAEFEERFSKGYFGRRAQATAFIAAFSLQFEFGPISEASIGNVGLHRGSGWVDHVVTPLAGLGLMVAEDAADWFLVARIERRTGNAYLKAIARLALNPARTMSNVAQGRAPWFRANRAL